MYDLGAFIGAGIVAGYGAVQVFAHLVHPDRLVVMDRRDQFHTVTRDRVTFTKGKRNGNT